MAMAFAAAAGLLLARGGHEEARALLADLAQVPNIAPTSTSRRTCPSSCAPRSLLTTGRSPFV